MYEFLKKNGQILALGLGVLVTVIFLVLIFTSGDASLTAESPDIEKYTSTSFGFGVWATTILLVLAALAAVGLGIAQLADNPKGSIKSLAGLGVVVVLILVGYGIASGTPEADGPMLVDAVNTFNDASGGEMSTTTYKFIGGTIIASLVLLAIAVISLLGFGVRSFFN